MTKYVISLALSWDNSTINACHPSLLLRAGVATFVVREWSADSSRTLWATYNSQLRQAPLFHVTWHIITHNGPLCSCPLQILHLTSNYAARDGTLQLCRNLGCSIKAWWYSVSSYYSTSRWKEESEKKKIKPPKVCQMKPKSSGPGSGSSIYQLRDITCFWVKWKKAERGKVGFLLHITTWR